MLFFGTDGIRGEADWIQQNEIPEMLGRAIASIGETPGCKQKANHIRVAVARDVRISSPDIERQLLRGLLEHDAEVYCLGILPTPGLVCVAQTLDVDFSVMITASHNAPSYNGLKVFDCHGEKLSPEAEENLDAQLLYTKTGNGKGIVHIVSDAEKMYINKIVQIIDTKFNGVIVHLDCANGCTAELASKIFSELGATVIAENDTRNGKIVNVGTGSTNMNYLCSKLHDGEIGFAFDGDGDRVLAAIIDDNENFKIQDAENTAFVDKYKLEKTNNEKNLCSNVQTKKTKVLDGDYFLLSLAILFQKEKLLGIPSVVATELSNGKLSLDLASKGITLERTDVGDKFVLEKMKQKSLILGGERSGHIIARCYSPTGDGILSALLLLKARQLGIFPNFEPYPQFELNIKVKNRDEALINPEFLTELNKIKKIIGKNGRIVVRKSGTEPLIRLMCESKISDISNFLTNLGNILRKI